MSIIGSAPAALTRSTTACHSGMVRLAPVGL
jgi:hypothetical protein